MCLVVTNKSSTCMKFLILPCSKVRTYNLMGSRSEMSVNCRSITNSGVLSSTVCFSVWLCLSFLCANMTCLLETIQIKVSMFWKQIGILSYFSTGSRHKASHQSCIELMTIEQTIIFWLLLDCSGVATDPCALFFVLRHVD